MGKPTKCKNPQEQYLFEKKKFEKRMKPKPVLADKIKRKEIRELEKHKKKQEQGKEKVFAGELE